MLKAVMFDFGHTIMDEVRGNPARLAPICLMPGIPNILTRVPFKMGVWANTRDARERDIRRWLRRAALHDYFEWVVTSMDAGARKPDRRFFSYALKQCGLKKEEVLFVGNQLNTDIRGANDYKIKCAWLSGCAYRSPDDTFTLSQARPTHIVSSLWRLPELLGQFAQLYSSPARKPGGSQ